MFGGAASTRVRSWPTRENATTFMHLPASHSLGIISYCESLMPKGLPGQLDEADGLDLVADTHSRGNKDHARFRKQELARR